jgi:dTDP-4-dehydrorhamnose reductase
MKIVLLGASGMLGSAFIRLFEKSPHTVIPHTSNTISFKHPSAIAKQLNLDNVDYVINCAAYTRVDDCETEQSAANLVNGTAVGAIAAHCHNHHVPFIHFSTDYVFNGQKTTPYTETDPVDPINAYGHSKLLGETAIQAECKAFYIFRIQWLYGANGKNFVDTISGLAEKKAELSVVSDQWGSPSLTDDIAALVFSALSAEAPYGIYHLANSGYTSWHEFATHIVEARKLTCAIQAVPSTEFPKPAARPYNSRLSCAKFNQLKCATPRTWQSAADAYLL